MIGAPKADESRLVRYGVLGLGIGMAHVAAAAASDKCLLCAVADIDEGRRSEFSAEYPGIPAYGTLEEMLAAEQLDAVSICLPTGMHAEYAVRALEAGLHVLIEKPVDTTADKALPVIEASRRTAKKCGVVFQNRYNFGLDPIYEHIADGSLGRIHLGSFAVKWYRDDAYYAANGGWRGTWAMDGGGSLMNQSIHTVDLMLRLMGKPTSVTTRMNICGHAIESEDLTVSILTFASGALATFTSTTCAYPGICTELSLTCENGYVALEADKLTAWKLKGASAEQEAEMLARYSIGNRRAQKLCRGRLFGHKRVVDDFCAAILDDKAPAVTVEDAVLPLRVICAAYESAKSGKTVFFD